jgi:hypothetical protein
VGYHNGNANHLDLYDGDQAFGQLVRRSSLADETDRIQRWYSCVRNNVKGSVRRNDKHKDRSMYWFGSADCSGSNILEIIFNI